MVVDRVCVRAIVAAVVMGAIACVVVIIMISVVVGCNHHCGCARSY